MIAVSDCMSLYRVIFKVKRAGEHKTAEQHEVKEDKLSHSAELCGLNYNNTAYIHIYSNV